MEICQVPREEALRVLDACHMDETMAIERILSGNGLSSWSQVSKKKKNTPNPRAAPRPSYQNDRDPSRDRRDRRDRDRSASHTSESANPQSNGYRRAQGPPRHSTSHHSQRSKDAPASGGPHGGRKRPQFPPQNPPANAQANEYHPQVTPTKPDQSSPSRTNFGDNIQTWSSPPTDGWADQKQPNGPTETWNDSQTTQSWGDSKSSPVANSGEQSWSDSLQASPPAAPNAWSVKDSADVKESIQPDALPKQDDVLPIDAPKNIPPQAKPAPSSTPSVKRTFNYAAAAAAGTSHEKPPAVVPERVSPPALLNPIDSESVGTDNVDDIIGSESTEARSTRSISRPLRPTNSEAEALQAESANIERRTLQTGANMVSPVGADVSVASESSPVAVPTPKSEPRLESPTPSGNAWAARPAIAEVKEDKRVEESVAAIAVASAAVGGNEAAGDALSLQFGSFGLGGLDVNWSASEQKPNDNVTPSPVPTSVPVSTPAPAPAPVPAPVTAPVPPKVVANEGNTHSITPVAKPAKSVSSPVANAAAASNVGVANAMQSAPVATAAAGGLDNGSGIVNGADMRGNNIASSGLPLPAASSAGNGSGMFPMLAMAPGGNFGPPNYAAPYLVPPLHGYTPALGSYENGSELGSSRGPNLGPPGSLPLYDPSNLSGMGSGNGKYGAIPGLGDMSGLAAVQSGVGKEGLQMNGGEMDKANGLGTSGLGAGMDPLAAPYMMPGYPSMQYPMYTFPPGPYGPPGMAPPGASPFPYAAAAGQVSSQGGRGGFGFDDGSVGLSASRNGNGLGESMYTPGGYLNNSMSHNVNQKAAADGSYKSVRGNGGGAGGGAGLGGMGMAGGMVSGMGYGDYGGGMGGVGNAVSSNVGGPGGWGNRQGNGIRADGGNVSSGMVSNGSMGGHGGHAGGGHAGGGQATSGYPGGQGGAAGAGGAGAYWTQQQGYYP